MAIKKFLILLYPRIPSAGKACSTCIRFHRMNFPDEQPVHEESKTGKKRVILSVLFRGHQERRMTITPTLNRSQ